MSRVTLCCLNDSSHVFEWWNHERKFCSKMCYFSYVRKPVVIKKRFWSLVEIGGEEECWLYGGHLDKVTGYGEFSYTRRKGETKSVLAHRFSYRITRGKIPRGLFVCHSCDNPPCCNPRHLWVGTQFDNLADMTEKGRRFSKLKEEDIPAVFNLLRQGFTTVELGEMYEVAQGTISQVKLRRTWKHIT
jgi:hypothetical protein